MRISNKRESSARSVFILCVGLLCTSAGTCNMVKWWTGLWALADSPQWCYLCQPLSLQGSSLFWSLCLTLNNSHTENRNARTSQNCVFESLCAHMHVSAPPLYQTPSHSFICHLISNHCSFFVVVVITSSAPSSFLQLLSYHLPRTKC